MIHTDFKNSFDIFRDTCLGIRDYYVTPLSHTGTTQSHYLVMISGRYDFLYQIREVRKLMIEVDLLRSENNS